MKGNVDKPAVKRRKVDCTTKIITDAEYLEKLKSYENEAKEIEERKRLRAKERQKLAEEKKKKGRKRARKLIDFYKDNDELEDEYEEGENGVEEESEEQEGEQEEAMADNDDDGSSDDEEAPENEEENLSSEDRLINIWKDLGPPKFSILSKFQNLDFQGKKTKILVKILLKWTNTLFSAKIRKL